ncbi:ABC transporter substrate-binding protein [Haliangium ochraceum]|uniref:Thiamine pyrimidine synthase n=1 Tax=Haliangium ochraceum (strain DSM 14365 / JCM 11303 / SMP-2) TaxID=502025 RepID=D0LUM2_HALO1|nr:ABC transporter substrate-binding protein [Haliangium ochraceum]ACY13912.1 NMT1/THI5 like domain protein [Haliangium ochraceum DSM 14365]
MSYRQPECALFWIAVVLAAVLGVSCKNSSSGPRELTLGLSWVHQAQFAGPYYADQKGLYEQEGLHVTFVPASIDHDPLDRFLAGEYDFVIAQPDGLIKARAQGHKVSAIAATYRIHPEEFLALADADIKTPEDFRGKKIGVSYSERLILKAMLRRAGMKLDEVEIVARQQGLESILSGDVDVQAGWVTNEGLAAEQRGIEVKRIVPYDHGVTFYADLYAVRDSLIVKEPELVEKFLRATMRGWAMALQDADANSRLALHYDPTLDAAHQQRILRASAPLIHTGADQIGWMHPAPWEDMIETVAAEENLSTRPELGELFTLHFLREIYDQQ